MSIQEEEAADESAEDLVGTADKSTDESEESSAENPSASEDVIDDSEEKK